MSVFLTEYEWLITEAGSASALRAERELLMAVARAAMKFCNERYEGDDPSEAEALNSLEKVISSLPKDLHAEVDAALHTFKTGPSAKSC